jgi:Ni/Co efflux regulator RcnB
MLRERLTMKTVLFSGIAAAAMLTMAPDANASDSAATSAVMMAQSGTATIIRSSAYVRPFRGFVVPTFWHQPRFYIQNFRNYGLAAPTNGYRWSRYYDDAVLMDRRGHVHDFRSGVEWNDGPDRTRDYREPEYGLSMRPDAAAYDWNDDVAFAAPDGSSYRYDGEWDGEYVDPQGRVFEGDWSGRVTRRDGAEAPGFPAGRQDSVYTGPPERRYSQEYTGPPERGYSDEYDVPRGYENYERCLKSNGLKGAAIGALLGGIAGNRIAGRGNRTGGSLIGAGIGGLLGVAAEKAQSKCGHHRPRHEPHARGPYYPPQNYYPQHHGWQGGYYYYPQAPMVTVTVAPGASHTTTTVTEEVYYETVKTYRKPARKWKPKPKPRCICR